MKALILAAGLGTRLKELTKTKPKCLMDIGGGETILDHVLERIENLGIKEIVVNTHYLAKQVHSHLKNRKNKATIHISHEEKILDTGGAIKHARKFLDGDSFIVHNVDLYSNFKLEDLVAAHTKAKSVITLGTNEKETERPLLCDADGFLAGWRNKKTGEEIISRPEVLKENLIELSYICISVYSPEIFKSLDTYGDAFSIVPVWLDLAKIKGTVATSTVTGEWIDIGTVEELNKARALRGG